jgi:hypothetical protein
MGRAAPHLLLEARHQQEEQMTNFANDAFFMATIHVLFLLGFYEMARHVVMLWV